MQHLYKNGGGKSIYSGKSIVIKKLLLLLLFTLSSFAKQIIVTGVDVTYECKETEHAKYYSMDFWAEGCPYPSHEALHTELIKRGFLDGPPPPCEAPQEPLPAPFPSTLGLHLDKDIPRGYKLIEENVTDEKTRTYPAYNGSTTVAANLRDYHGYCYSMSADFWWTADEYKGLIKAKYFTRVYEKTCSESDISLPTPTQDEMVLLSWDEDSNKSQECLEANGVIQEGRVNCKAVYQCIKKTQSCPTIPIEPINSYVDPSDRSFSEDINLDGLNFSLHYKSSDFNTTGSLAKGWSLSIHHKFKDGKLYLGNGAVLAGIKPVKDGENSLITVAGKIYIFDKSLKHIATKDAYTNKTLLKFGYKDGKLVTITDQFNQTTNLFYNRAQKLESIVAPHGQTTEFNIDSSGDLIEAQYEDGSSYTFEYKNHLMVKDTEPNGNSFEHIFNDKGKVLKVVDAEAGEWSFENSNTPFGQKVVTRASGDKTIYKNYPLKNGFLKFETILSSGDTITTLKAVDDSQDSKTSCGVTTTRKFKILNGKLAKDPINHQRVLESITTTTPSGLKRELKLDSQYKLARSGKLESITINSTLNGKTSTSIRDYKKHNYKTVSPLGKVNKIKYKADNKEIKWIKPYGLHKIKYNYDDEGRVVKTEQGKRVIDYSYNQRGDLESITDSKGRVTQYEYDSRDRLIKTIYPNGNTLEFAYDKNGNMTILTTPTPSDYTFEYNGVNKRTSVNSPINEQTTYTYDKARRVTQITHPSGKSINFKYKNERLDSIETDSGITNYTYACQGNIATIRKNREELAYKYDGELLTNIRESGKLYSSIDFTYNNDFLLNSISYAGTRVNYSYNNDNEPIKIGNYNIERSNKNRVIKISDGTFSQRIKLNKYGEIKKQSNNNYSYKLKYNKNAQIVKKVEKVANKKVIYKYKYDKQGRLVEVKSNYTKDKNLVKNPSFEKLNNDSEEFFTNWHYYGAGRVDTYKSNAHSGIYSVKIFNITDMNSGVRGENIAINRAKVITFSGWSKAQDVSDNALYALDFKVTFADGSYKWYYTDTKFKTGTHDWQQVKVTTKFDKPVVSIRPYVLLYRGKGTVWFDDIKVTVKKKRDNKKLKVVEEYRYDKNSNRVYSKVYGKEQTAQYTLDDKLKVFGNNTYRYNEDGNLIEKTTPQGVTNYSYDDFNNLKEVTLPNNKTITYQQNANNQRVAKLVNGEVKEKYLWLNLTTLLAIYDKDNNLIQRFEYANGRMPISMTDKNNNRYYLHYDQVGSLRAVTDTNGNIVKEITYDSYGNILNDTNPDFKVPFGFAGGLYDEDTKLVHFGYREYDPETGRWLSKDPLLFGGGDSNLYGYVLQDPVNLVDPFGLSGTYGQNFVLPDGSGWFAFFGINAKQAKPAVVATKGLSADIKNAFTLNPEAKQSLLNGLDRISYVSGFTGGMLNATGIGSEVGTPLMILSFATKGIVIHYNNKNNIVETAELCRDFSIDEAFEPFGVYGIVGAEATKIFMNTYIPIK